MTSDTLVVMELKDFRRLLFSMPTMLLNDILRKERTSCKYHYNRGVVWPYEFREEVKRACHEVMHHKHSNAAEKVHALDNLSRAHYWRAIEQWDSLNLKQRRKIVGWKCPKQYDLTIDKYTSHWFASMRNYLFENEHEAWKLFEDMYILSVVQSKYMPKGYTLYDV